MSPPYLADDLHRHPRQPIRHAQALAGSTRRMETLMYLRTKYLYAVLTACLAFLAAPPLARAEVEEARAVFTPWSGSWYPRAQGGLINSLKKYDEIMGTSHAARWEQINHPSQRAAKWEGYCNGWSAASILEREPTAAKEVRDARGNRVRLSVADQKALLAVAHYQDSSDSIGRRNDNPNLSVNSAEYQDIAPDKLWNYLRSHIQQRGAPIIIDSSAGVQVWNYPVYRYRVSWRADAGDQVRAHLTLWMADDAVDANFVGTKALTKEYDFVCKMRGNNIVEGSGKWIGQSVSEHPDFAWSPHAPHAENPEIKYDALVRMLGLRR